MSLAQIANKTKKIFLILGFVVLSFFTLFKGIPFVLASINSYTFVGVTQESDDNFAYSDIGTSVFSDSSGVGKTEATNSDYSAIAIDDDSRWQTAGAVSDGEYDSQLFKFYVDETESDISQLDFKWNGYGETTSDYNTTLYAWNYDGSAWVQLDQVDFTAATDQDLTSAESVDPGKFIDTDGAVTLMVKTKKYVEPEFCSVPADYKSTKTIEEKIVYCDADGEMWTETAGSTYAWNSSGSGSCLEACNYCNGLSYAGYDDWYLPTCTNDGNLPGSCQLYQFGVDNCDWTGTDGGQSSCTPAWDTSAASNYYWSSTEYDRSSAWHVPFTNGNVNYFNKDSSYYVRCVR